MNERGINSFGEFLLFYLFAGFIVGALWVILEADVVLAPVRETAERRSRRLRITRVLAPLGIVHLGFALLAADAARRDSEERLDMAIDRRRHRAAVEARISLALGVLALVILTAPHLPMLEDTPGAVSLADAIPWE